MNYIFPDITLSGKILMFPNSVNGKSEKIDIDIYRET